MLSLMVGCVSPFGGGGADEPAGLDRDLAVRPEPLEVNGQGEVTGPLGPRTEARGSPSEDGMGEPGVPVEPGEQVVTPTTEASAAGPDRPRREFARLLALDDRAGDHGLEGRPYGDARRLVIEEDGTRLRVTLVVGGDLPPRLRDREVMGIGVDLHRSDPSESDYQLFAEGSADGWFAYLHAPDGLVEYPGTFHLGGNRVVLEVPWDAVGGRRPAEVRAFVDWSQGQVALLATTTHDQVPDRGTAEVAPAR